MNQALQKKINEIVEGDRRYHPDVYEFVMEALSYAQKKHKRIRHVSGDELLGAIRSLMLKKYGPMAITVLSHWHVKSTEDFGHVVFNLVGKGILCREEQDTFDGFRNGYDFEEAFVLGYVRELERQVSRLK